MNLLVSTSQNKVKHRRLQGAGVGFLGVSAELSRTVKNVEHLRTSRMLKLLNIVVQKQAYSLAGMSPFVTFVKNVRTVFHRLFVTFVKNVKNCLRTGPRTGRSGES